MIRAFITYLAARHLSHHRVHTERALIRAKARDMHKAMGLPAKGVLNG